MEGGALIARTLEVTFNASGAAEAGARGRVVCVVDVVDSSTSGPTPARRLIDLGHLTLH